jgi:hypothetical protein
MVVFNIDKSIAGLISPVGFGEPKYSGIKECRGI